MRAPTDVSGFSLIMLAPPKTLASSRERSAPFLISALMSSSIAAAPKRMSSPDGCAPDWSPGSRKWFIPPTPTTGSRRQAATQEPSTVDRTSPSLAAKSWPPGATLMMRALKRWSK